MKGAKPKQDAIRRGISDAYTIDQPKTVGVTMPADIKASPMLSTIWEFIAPDVNNFTEQDIPNLRLLCTWHAVAAQCQDALIRGDDKVNIVEVMGEKSIKTADGKVLHKVREHPAIGTLKKASAEIRALSDQLGLSPLARSRIGLMQATTVKTAADTAKMFQSINAAYKLPK